MTQPKAWCCILQVFCRFPPSESLTTHCPTKQVTTLKQFRVFFAKVKASYLYVHAMLRLTHVFFFSPLRKCYSTTYFAEYCQSNTLTNKPIFSAADIVITTPFFPCIFFFFFQIRRPQMSSVGRPYCLYETNSTDTALRCLHIVYIVKPITSPSLTPYLHRNTPLVKCSQRCSLAPFQIHGHDFEQEGSVDPPPDKWPRMLSLNSLSRTS